jgi:hypothetical protein
MATLSNFTLNINGKQYSFCGRCKRVMVVNGLCEFCGHDKALNDRIRKVEEKLNTIIERV